MAINVGAFTVICFYLQCQWHALSSSRRRTYGKLTAFSGYAASSSCAAEPAHAVSPACDCYVSTTVRKRPQRHRLHLEGRKGSFRRACPSAGGSALRWPGCASVGSLSHWSCGRWAQAAAYEAELTFARPAEAGPLSAQVGLHVPQPTLPAPYGSLRSGPDVAGCRPLGR